MDVPNSFIVSGVEPQLDPAWHLAPDAIRAAFWDAVVPIVLAAKDRELAAGLDIYGEGLVPISAATRKKGRRRSHTGMGAPGNPPLTPALGLSRTRGLITGQAYPAEGFALFWWKFDDVTGRSWGEILGYHAAGAGRLPVRDVIGLSPDSLATVKVRALAWWDNFKRGYPVFNEAGEIGLKIGVKAPISVKLIGRTDLENATFGIGGGRERSQLAINRGLSGGFTSKADRAAIRAKAAKAAPPKPVVPKPVVPKPAPTPKPVAPKPIAKPPVTPVAKPVTPKPVVQKPAPVAKPVVKPPAPPPTPVAPKPPADVVPPPGGQPDLAEHIHQIALEMAAADPKGKVSIPELRTRVAFARGAETGNPLAARRSQGPDAVARYAASEGVVPPHLPFDIAFDKAVLALDRADKLRLIAAGDKARFTHDQLNRGIAGDNELFMKVEPGPASTPVPAAPAAWTPRPQSDFRAFTAATAMEDFGRSTSGDWAESLKPSEAAAIKLYASDNYKWMNAILRGEDPMTLDLPHGLSPAGARDYIAKTIARLARATVNQDVVAFRGVKDLAAMGIDPAKLVEGQGLTIEGFASTSLSRDKAADFATNATGSAPITSNPERAIFQINTPAGSTGAYLNAGELSGYGSERELLMPPAAQLKFVRIGGTHKDVWGNETPILVFERTR